jgi:hypothetical protein
MRGGAAGSRRAASADYNILSVNGLHGRRATPGGIFRGIDCESGLSVYRIKYHRKCGENSALAFELRCVSIQCGPGAQFDKTWARCAVAVVRRFERSRHSHIGSWSPRIGIDGFSGDSYIASPELRQIPVRQLPGSR